MSGSCRASICLLAEGDAHEQFYRCLRSDLDNVPLERIELRCAFARAPRAFHYMLGTLVPDGAHPSRYLLPMGIERFHFTTDNGVEVWAWNREPVIKGQPSAFISHTPEVSSQERELFMRHLLRDVRLKTEYAVCLATDAEVAPGWWDRLARVMHEKVDYFGTPAWHAYTPREVERIQMQPWYMGVPWARRDGKGGVEFMTGPIVGIRSERLHDVKYPGEVMLGEMAWQLGWRVKGERLGMRDEVGGGF